MHNHGDQGCVNHFGLDTSFVHKREPLRRIERDCRIHALVALFFIDLANAHHLVTGEKEHPLFAGIFLEHARRLIAELIVQAARVDFVRLDNVGIGGNDAVESVRHGSGSLQRIGRSIDESDW